MQIDSGVIRASFLNVLGKTTTAVVEAASSGNYNICDRMGRLRRIFASPAAAILTKTLYDRKLQLQRRNLSISTAYDPSIVTYDCRRFERLGTV